MAQVESDSVNVSDRKYKTFLSGERIGKKPSETRKKNGWVQLSHISPDVQNS